MILLLRRRARGLGAGVRLDGIAGAWAAAAVGAALLVPVLLAAGEGSTSTVATNLAYPLADLLRPRTPPRCAACGSSAASWSRASS